MRSAEELSMSEMVIRTLRFFPAPAGAVWSLMCNSRMDDASSVWFKLGVPHPVECRLPDGLGGVGTERECVSDQGIVHQRILVWEPERRLSFRMEHTDLRFRRYVSEIVDTFDLAPVPAGVEVTRTTVVELKGPFQALKKIALYLSVRQVHRYVFRNWLRRAPAAPPVYAFPDRV